MFLFEKGLMRHPIKFKLLGNMIPLRQQYMHKLKWKGQASIVKLSIGVNRHTQYIINWDSKAKHQSWYPQLVWIDTSNICINQDAKVKHIAMLSASVNWHTQYMHQPRCKGLALTKIQRSIINRDAKVKHQLRCPRSAWIDMPNVCTDTPNICIKW